MGWAASGSPFQSDRHRPPKASSSFSLRSLSSSLPLLFFVFPGFVLAHEKFLRPRGASSPTNLHTFHSRDSHVVPKPRPPKHAHGQTQPASQQRRKWIHTQLVPWSTVPFDPTAGLRRSEPGTFDPRLSAGSCKSDFGCGWAHSERHGTNDRRGWNVCQLQWGEAEEYPGGLLSDGGLCSGVAKI